MKGDALASGQRSAVFTGPKIKFTEGEIIDDVLHLTKQEFISKHMITEREYDMIINSGDDEKVSAFAAEMQQRAEFANRQLKADAQQEATLKRECFLTPFVAEGIIGRVIVARDGPVDKPSALLIPKSMRKDKTLLPTTGHVIKETLFGGASLLGKRVLFSPMSGTAICFKGYPTWIQLELTEILAVVNKEDAELQDETLEPMV